MAKGWCALRAGLVCALFTGISSAEPAPSFPQQGADGTGVAPEPQSEAASSNFGEPLPLPQPKPELRRWYGWQTLIADGVATALLVAVLSSDAAADGDGAWAVLGAYLVAPPIIHLAHQRPAVALGSLGLRVGLPFGGALLGYGACGGDDGGGYECIGTMVVGFGVGIVSAMVVDAALLARENPAPRALSIAPHPLPGGAGLTARGVF